MNAKTIIILILAVILVIILFQSAQPVELKFLLWEIRMSQILFVAILLGIGFVLGFITRSVRKRKK
ncbi:MAG TPA: LapA family protein [bacterium]|nr:LapA family protein [bacterium]